MSFLPGAEHAMTDLKRRYECGFEAKVELIWIDDMYLLSEG